VNTGAHREGAYPVKETPDRWDRVIAFPKTGKGLALLGAEFAFVILWDNSTLTIPLKVGPLVLAACYCIAVGVKSVQGFKSGHRGRN